MNSRERLYMHKAECYRLRILGYQRTVEKGQQKLEAAQRQVKTLQDQHAAQTKLLDNKASEAHEYKTALVAAFKIVDELASKTTMADLMARTRLQVRRGGGNAAVKPEGFASQDTSPAFKGKGAACETNDESFAKAARKLPFVRGESSASKKKLYMPKAESNDEYLAKAAPKMPALRDASPASKKKLYEGFLAKPALKTPALQTLSPASKKKLYVPEFESINESFSKPSPKTPALQTLSPASKKQKLYISEFLAPYTSDSEEPRPALEQQEKKRPASRHDSDSDSAWCKKAKTSSE